MLSRKLNAKAFVCLVALILVLALVGRVTWMWLNNQIVDEHEPGEVFSALYDQYDFESFDSSFENLDSINTG